MAKLNNTDGFILHGWMVNELGLRGGGLFAFALIHQFSQSDAGVYKGGVPYLAAWLGCSGNTTLKKFGGTLKNLEGDPQEIEGYTPKKLEGGTLKKFGGENNNRKVKGDNNREHSPAFKKPSIDEVRYYCLERGNDIDPEEFWAFYESKGWKVGTAPMKDWKAAIITWERKRKQLRPVPRPPKEPPLADYYTNLIQGIREQYGTTPGLDID